MNIGIDIDDTITETYKVTDLYAKEYTENILKRKFVINKIEISDPMWAKYLYSWTVEEDKNFWYLYYEKVVDNTYPKDEAIEIINELSEENNIIIISARINNNIIAQKTEEWLKRYKVKYNKLFLNHLDKRQIAKENNIDLFIDDSFNTCKQISKMGIRTFLMNSRVNKDIEDEKIERVFSWKEIKEKIEN